LAILPTGIEHKGI